MTNPANPNNSRAGSIAAKARFLHLLRSKPGITRAEAMRQIEYSSRTYEHWRRTDPEFRAECDRITQRGAASLKEALAELDAQPSAPAEEFDQGLEDYRRAMAAPSRGDDWWDRYDASDSQGAV